MKTLNRNLGFTLIEVVVVTALVGICGYILVTLFLGQNHLYESETAQLQITGDARASLDDIDSYVRQADQVLSTYSTYTSGSQVLILQIQSIDSSNNLIGGTYDDVVYYLTGTSFYEQVFPNASSARPAMTKKIASNVNSLAFTYDNSTFSLVTSVTTNITIQINAGTQTRSLTASSQSILRNY